MTIVDAREPGLPASLDADVCIVGAGAAGVTLANQLLPGGLDICLVESGGFAPDAEVQALHDFDSTGYPVRPNYMSRARYFGGSCNLWAGRGMELQPIDFEQRDWVPHSGWPISHAEVAKYYAAAAGLLGMPDLGRTGGQELSTRLSEHERSLFQDGVFAPTVSVWGRKAMRFGAAFRSRFRSARNLRLVLNASATGIRLDASGLVVRSVLAQTLAGSRFEIRARRFVLACGGIENARLLLASRDRHPNGVGNDHDLVGRFFMDHPRAVFGRVHLPAGIRLPLMRGRPLADGKVQLGIGLAPATQRRECLLNHYVTLEEQSSGYAEAGYQSAIQAAQVILRRGYAGKRWNLMRARLTDVPNLIYLLSPKELMPHALYRVYVATRDRIPRRPRPRTFVAVYFCEQPPDPASRVVLGNATDRLGMNRVRLHWHLPGSVTQTMVQMQELLRSELERTGIGALEASRDEPLFTDASHHMGTTRMSAGPRSGVVDTDCRVHGLSNLYVAGSSVFPCAGHANPTPTIIALTLRLAEHLQAQRNTAGAA